MSQPSNELLALSMACDMLTNEQKINLRKKLELEELPAPRSLYFDYKKQQWIDESQYTK